MSRFLKRLHVASIDELGRCLFCVRAALASACVVGVVAVVLALVAPSAVVTLLAFLMAIALAMLWVAHLTAHAARVANARQARSALRAQARSTAPTRREMFNTFFGAFFALAVASAFVASTRRALAADEGCPENAPSGCGTQYCCSGPARWHCQGYSGYAEPWRTMVNFCSNASSDEDIADLRSNCAELVSC
jgi:hypothetical protein